MTYTDFKAKQEKEFSAFPMFFAFSDKQLKEGMEKFNAQPSDLCRIPGSGFILKKDKDSFHKLLDKMTNDKKDFLRDDTNLINAIQYELGNHEFCITYDPTDTIEALELDFDDKRTVECFEKAKNYYLASAIY